METDKVKLIIKQAAKDLFRKYGYQKTSVNEIAKKAKIAKATIYKYFESKEVVLQAIIMDYLTVAIQDIMKHSNPNLNAIDRISHLLLQTSRLSYTVCNEFIGWDFIRESANAQEFLKILSDDLETLIIDSFIENDEFARNPENIQPIRFLVKSSKSIVFSFAFTSVTVADVKKNFISFEKELLPFLVKAAIK